MIANMDKLALCMLYGLPGFIQQAGAHAVREHQVAICQFCFP